MPTKFIPTLIAAALASACFANVQAATTVQTETRQRVVSFADLDLNRDDDVAALYRRIRKAAREVCRAPGVEERLSTSSARHCAAEALARAVSDVRSTSLTRYHAVRCSTACEQSNEFALVLPSRTAAETRVAERR